MGQARGFNMKNYTYLDRLAVNPVSFYLLNLEQLRPRYKEKSIENTEEMKSSAFEKRGSDNSSAEHLSVGQTLLD